MNIETWTKITNELLGSRGGVQIISSEKITVSKVEIDNPMDLPVHNHEHEQITIVTEGEMFIKYEMVEKIVKAGEVCIIPSNIPHSVRILKVPFKSFDIFSPVREDFVKQAKLLYKGYEL